MKRSTWITMAVAIAVLAAILALVVAGAQADRERLVEAFGSEHLWVVRGVTREVESDVEEIRENLDFARRLVRHPLSVDDARSELEALLAVVRDYRAATVVGADGRFIVDVYDPTAPPGWTDAPHHESIRDAARAVFAGSKFAISKPLEVPGGGWYRAFGVPTTWRSAPAALVLLVDLERTLAQLRGVASPQDAKLLFIGPHGKSMPPTDAAFVPVVADGGEREVADVIRRMRAGEAGFAAVSTRDARRMGFPDGAIAVFAPVRLGLAGTGTFGVLFSSARLRDQQARIVVSMLLLSIAALAAIGGGSAYVLAVGRRSATASERIRAAEQLAALRERSEKILETVPVAAIALDPLGRVTVVNRAARDRLSAQTGARLRDALPTVSPDAVSVVAGLVEDATGARAPRRIVSMALELAGEERQFTVQAVPLEHPTSEVSTLLVLEDVTELRALSEQLLRAEKLATVGVLAAGFAHEVGTPLGVVRGRAERIRAKLGDAHAQAPSLDVVVEEIDRIARLIRELLDFATPSAADARPVSLANVAGAVRELLAFESRSRGVALRVDVAPELPRLAADPDQLKQVLVNLALNGIQACVRGGEVRIAARADPVGGVAVVEVVDDGAGMPGDVQRQVFDPFFTTKKRGKGTGLGLTVVAQIVRRHGGEIALTSGLGRGTCVEVRWPLASATEDTDAGAERQAHPRGR